VSRSGMLKSVGLLMGATMAGKVLLLVRESLIAHFFGASSATDSYNVAMTVVSALMAVTVAPISAVLVPVYTGWLTQERDGARELLNAAFTLYSILLGLALAVAILAAPVLVALAVPGFAAETQSLTVELLHILAFFMVLNGLAGYAQQILAAHYEFRLIGLAPVTANLLTVILLWLLAPALGIHILAWGTVAGAALQLLVFAWGMRRYGLRQGFSRRRWGELRQLGQLSLWMVAGRFIGQLSELVDRNLLSWLPAGAIATLRFAQYIYLLPFEIFTTGITRVVITYFSWDVAQGDVQALKQNLSLSIRLAAFFMLPATVGLTVLGVPIVRLLYERGQFTAGDTTATALVVGCFAAGLFFEAVKFIAGRVFLSRQDVRFLTLMSLPSLALTVFFDLLLIPVLGAAGVALSASLGNLIIGAVFLARLRAQLGPLGGARMARAILKIGTASAGMGLVVYGATRLPVHLPAGVAYEAVELTILVTLGVLAYLAGLYALRLEELSIVRDLARGLWRKCRAGNSRTAA